MDTLLHVLNQGWVGSALGGAGLLLAFVFYRMARIGARPTFEMKGVHLLGGKDQVLPQEVEIRYLGVPVKALTKTSIVIWNAGKATILGKQIVEADPLRVDLRHSGEILDFSVVRKTRAVNQFSVKPDPERKGVLLLGFDYLDPGDGATIVILHTSDDRLPAIAGSMRGIPEGFRTHGPFPHEHQPGFRQLFFQPFLLGSALVTAGLLGIIIYGDRWLNDSPSALLLQSWSGMLSSLYLVVGLVLVWLSRRRRYPKILSLEVDRSRKGVVHSGMRESRGRDRPG